MIRGITLLVAATALVMAPSALAASPKVSVTYPNAPTAGQAFAVVAKLTPAKKGVKLSLQQKLAGKWKTLASGKTDKKGVAILSAKLSEGSAVLRLSGKVGSRSLISAPKSLTVSGGGVNTGGGGTGGGGTGGGGTGPLFNPPGRDLTGNEAAQAIVPYLTNSTFTDCVPGWPNCAVENRYGHFASGEMYYCRLTNTSGADIINAGHPFQIVGADMKADGSWGVTLKVVSYGDAITYYTWQVSTTGVAYANYWGPGLTPGVDSPSQSIGPLQWVRGARNCSY